MGLIAFVSSTAIAAVPTPSTTIGGARVTATMTQTPIDINTKSVTADLTIVTGKRAFKRWVEQVPPSTVTRTNGAIFTGRRVLFLVDGPQFIGPGQSSGSGSSSGTGAFADCADSTSDTTSEQVTIPANSTTTLRYKYFVTDEPITFGTSFAPTFKIASGNDPFPSRRSKVRKVRPVQPAVTFPFLARIDLNFTPRAPGILGRYLARVKLGKSVGIGGQLWPPLPGKSIVIDYFPDTPLWAIADSKASNVGSAVTDANGAFYMTWKPPRRGFHALLASYPASNGELAENANCGFTVYVR